ncbi:hypothetical protein ABRP77_07730 [Pectobacterium odoriferum]|uniref:hypothetical protein n=1 Tax=Pectobacterium odoriferum TaxID=78398 RepID=UPI0032EAE7CE
MSNLKNTGIGPITVIIDWLDNCPKCDHEKARVIGFSISTNSLWSGNPVVCNKCGHLGEIDADGENAWVEWDEYFDE